MEGAIREIHSAYGITLKGEIQEYTWYDGKVDNVIWRIWANEREVYLGHSFFIICEDPTNQRINIEADKDVLCWYLAHTPMTDEELEDFFIKEYHHTLWKYHARNRMFKERQDAENTRLAEERKAKHEAEMNEIKAYADKKKYYVIVEYNDVYFIKYDKRKYKAEDLDKVGADRVLQFAKEYPGHGVDIAERRTLAV